MPTGSEQQSLYCQISAATFLWLKVKISWMTWLEESPALPSLCTGNAEQTLAHLNRAKKRPTRPEANDVDVENSHRPNSI